ncbi:hypothetical protein ACFL46_01305 [Candidatus Neomarinimicrobiota bacterium]
MMELAKVTYKKISGNDVIFIEALENPTTDSMLAMVKKVKKLREKYDCDLVLLDGRKSRSIPPFPAILQMAKEFLLKKDLSGLKIAMITGENIKSNVGFFANFMTNRGILINRFSDMDSAEDWLFL